MQWKMSASIVALITSFCHAGPCFAAVVTSGVSLVVVDLSPTETKALISGTSTLFDLAGRDTPEPFKSVLKSASVPAKNVQFSIPDGQELRFLITSIPAGVVMFPKQDQSRLKVIEAFQKHGNLQPFFENTLLVTATESRLVVTGYTSQYVPQSGGFMGTPSGGSYQTVPIWGTTTETVIKPVGHTRKSNRAGFVESNRESVGLWEQFRLFAHSDGKYSFHAHTGFLCAEAGGGREVRFNRDSPDVWEKWTIVPNSDGTISLKSSEGYYLSCPSGSEAEARCISIGPAEKFRLSLHEGYATIRTANGRYVSAQP